MIVGKIVGKTSTTQFEFRLDHAAKKFDFLQVQHPDVGFVLCQVIELVRDSEKTIGMCNVLGYEGEDGMLHSLRTPLVPGSEVLLAQDEFVAALVQSSGSGALIGRLQGKDIAIRLDYGKLLSKHVCVLAKSGSGKSYAAGVLVEEILEKGIPLLIVDPHGEYRSLSESNDLEKDRLLEFGLKPTSYHSHLVEYGDVTIDSSVRQLGLSSAMNAEELLALIPQKLSSAQSSLLYQAMQEGDRMSFDEVLASLSLVDHPSKWSVVSAIQSLARLPFFASPPTPLHDLVVSGRAAILNLRGVHESLSQMIVATLLRSVFEARKKNQIPPLFCVIEEAHNFMPERSFGEVSSSAVIRSVASEGRKFGMGLCVISQRPARVDKSVISQCSTQIILKMTNPGDIRAVMSSMEGITSQAEVELQNLAVGEALVLGHVDMPLVVSIRPRKTKHGGTSPLMEEGEVKAPLEIAAQESTLNSPEMRALVRPRITFEDLSHMSDVGAEIKTYLVPAVFVHVRTKQGEIHFLVDRVRGYVIVDLDNEKYVALLDLGSFSSFGLELVEIALNLETFTSGQISMHTSMSPSRVDNLLDLFVKGGYLERTNGTYTLLSPLRLISHSAEFASKATVEYGTIRFDEEFDPKLTQEEIVRRLNLFCDVLDAKEVWVVKYEAEKK